MLIKKSSNNKKLISWVCEAELRMRLQQEIKFTVSQASFFWGITSQKMEVNLRQYLGARQIVEYNLEGNVWRFPF